MEGRGIGWGTRGKQDGHYMDFQEELQVSELQVDFNFGTEIYLRNKGGDFLISLIEDIKVLPLRCSYSLGMKLKMKASLHALPYYISCQNSLKIQQSCEN